MIPFNSIVMARAFFGGRNAPWSFLLADNDVLDWARVTFTPANDPDPNGVA